MDRDALGSCSRHSWRCRVSKGHCCCGCDAEKPRELLEAHVNVNGRVNGRFRPHISVNSADKRHFVRFGFDDTTLDDTTLAETSSCEARCNLDEHCLS